MPDQTLTQLMLKIHEDTKKLFLQFEESLGKDLGSAVKALERFKKEIEMHFYYEESTAFKYCKDVAKNNDGISNLVSQHSEIMEIINDIKNNLKTEKKVELSGLKKLLEEHYNIENAIFYPRLDSEVKEGEKKLIIKKIKKYYYNY